MSYANLVGLNRFSPGFLQDWFELVWTGFRRFFPVSVRFFEFWKLLGPVSVPVLPKMAKKPDWTGPSNTMNDKLANRNVKRAVKKNLS
jgi:hypothetical protein